MNRLRFSTRTAFIAMTLIATYFGASRLYQNWFAHRYSGYVLSWKLAELQNGMSLDRVQSSFSYSTRLRPSDVVDLGPTEGGKIRSVKGFRNASPPLINMVKGVFEQMATGDELYLFEDFTGGSAYLQFRSGVLINHSPKLFVPTIELAKTNRVPFPNFALRFGILPYFVLLVIAGLCVARSFKLHQRQRTYPNAAP